MGLVLTYMILNLLILTRYEILLHTCTPTIFLTSVSLFYMVASSSSRNHFYSWVFSWWPLSTCSRYLHHRSTHRTSCLDPPLGKLPIQRIPWPRIYCHHLICLSQSPSQIVDSNTNCYKFWRELNIREIFTNEPSDNHINESDITL